MASQLQVLGYPSSFADLASAGAPINLSNNDGDSDWPQVIGVEPNHALVAWEDDTPFPGVRAVLVGCR